MDITRMKRSLALTSLLALIVFNTIAQPGTGDVGKKIDSLFSRYNSESPGVSVAVVRDGKVIFKKGYGSANLEHGIPNTPTTVFQVASVSKQFTAFAICLLEKQGKISFEDDVRKYLPELPRYGKPITINHLLAHTSGLRDLWAFLSLAGWHMEDVITTGHIIKLATKQKELNFETGTAFGYSNTGYTLLARIVERATGQRFSDFTRSNIFAPLQMDDTQFCDDYHKVVKNRAHSYEKSNGDYVKKELNYSDVGPTSLLTTVEDMVKWANYLDHPQPEAAQLIEQFNRVSLLDNNKPVVWSARGRDTTYHAKGQLRWRHKGLNVITHGGHVAGFRAWLARFPENKFSIITLSNDEHYDILGTGLQIAEFYLKNEFKEEVAAANIPAGPANTKAEKYDRHIKDFEGTYYSEELSTAYVIKAQDDKLTMSHSRLTDIQLTRIGEHKFSGTNSFAFELEFVVDGKKIVGFRISNFGAKNVKFMRVRS